jgi:lipopolysaccharide/colanic/teichoic acid biosynthesis glycosyltransferase
MALLTESRVETQPLSSNSTPLAPPPPIERDRGTRSTVALPPFIAPRVEEAFAPMPDVVGWLSHGKPLMPPIGNRSLVYLGVKRLLDLVGALACLILFAPIMLTTYVVLFITTRGKPIFCQERVGHCGKLFPMFKFRTMRLDAHKLQSQVKNEKDGPIFKNRRDPRITTIGRFLRSTSIDEMPQLFNILLGHMSLVGPRPPIAAEVVQYKAWQFGRLGVKPGLTCLWQISGRCEIGFEDWVRMDLWYVDHQNLRTDLKLLIRTPLSVLSRRGAY